MDSKIRLFSSPLFLVLSRRSHDAVAEHRSGRAPRQSDIRALAPDRILLCVHFSRQDVDPVGLATRLRGPPSSSLPNFPSFFFFFFFFFCGTYQISSKDKKKKIANTRSSREVNLFSDECWLSFILQQIE
jgi:hypothetical protein